MHNFDGLVLFDVAMEMLEQSSLLLLFEWNNC
jgi:hypothetical protein